MRASLALAVAALAGCAGLTPSAHASSKEPVQLTWITPEPSDCPERAEILASIRRYIGPDAGPGHTPIEAVATIRRRAGGELELVLNTFDGTARGQRVFRDNSCRSIADAAVVVLAWMIDPDGMAARSAAPPSVPSLPEAKTANIPAAPSPPVRWKPYVGAGVNADWGTLPGLTWGLQLRLGVWVERLRFEAHTKYWPSARKALPALMNGAVPGAEFNLWGLGLDACLELFSVPASSRVGLAFCLGPELELLNGAGFGVTVPADATKTWLSLTAGFAGRFRVADPVLMVFGVGGSLPFQRERFALRGVGEVHRPSLLAARLELGMELEL